VQYLWERYGWLLVSGTAIAVWVGVAIPIWLFSSYSLIFEFPYGAWAVAEYDLRPSPAQEWTLRIDKVRGLVIGLLSTGVLVGAAYAAVGHPLRVLLTLTAAAVLCLNVLGSLFVFGMW